MRGERPKERPPDGRELGEAGDLHGAENGGRMGDTAGRGGDDVDGPDHAGGKLRQDRRLQPRDGLESRMLGRARRKVDTGAPGLVQGVRRRVDHAGQ